MADYLAKLRATEEKVVEGQQAVEITKLHATDRSHIARLIIRAFVCAFWFVIVAICVGTYFLTWDKISEPAKVLVALLSSVMLPVVTLVVGHFFSNK